jgi:hypothetical protein
MFEHFSRLSHLCLFLLLAGCTASTQVSITQRSTIEQQLLVRSLERAMAELDTRQLRGKMVSVDFYGLTPDRDFAKEFFTVWLQGQQVRITPDPDKAELRLKIFASALGVDRGQTFMGVPSFTAPVVGFAVPEVALFKSVQHRGHAEVQVYTLDGGSGDFIEKSPAAVGEAKHDNYTILILVNFTLSDIDEDAEKQQR